MSIEKLAQSLPPEISCPDCMVEDKSTTTISLISGPIYPATLKGYSKGDMTATYQCKRTHITVKFISQLQGEFKLKDRNFFLMDGTQVTV